MEEAAEADYVVIIDSGKIVAKGTPLQLKNTYTGDFITLYGISEAAVKTLGVAYEPLRDVYRLAVPDTAAATALIVKHPEVFKDYEITKGKMDDVFLAVTGKALEGVPKMTTTAVLIKRNIKLFFKDKGMFLRLSLPRRFCWCYTPPSSAMSIATRLPPVCRRGYARRRDNRRACRRAADFLHSRGILHYGGVLL